MVLYGLECDGNPPRFGRLLGFIPWHAGPDRYADLASHDLPEISIRETEDYPDAKDPQSATGISMQALGECRSTRLKASWQDSPKLASRGGVDIKKSRLHY